MFFMCNGKVLHSPTHYTCALVQLQVLGVNLPRVPRLRGRASNLGTAQLQRHRGPREPEGPRGLSDARRSHSHHGNRGTARVKHL